MKGCLALFYLLGIAMGVTGSDELRLITDLFKSNYVTDVFPLLNNTATLKVFFGLGAVNLVDLDEREGVLHMMAWLRMAWNDERLVWDPAKYGRIKVIRINANRVWKPDMELYNSAEDSKLIPDKSKTNILIYSSGSVLWVPPKIIRAKCQVDLRRFPFDKQECSLMFGSWTFDGYKIDLDFYEARKALDLADYTMHNEWTLLSTTAKRRVIFYPCCTEPYPSLVFNVTFERKWQYYSNIFIGPAVLMALLVPLVFLLPPESGEKVTLGGAVMICLMLLELLLENYLPSAFSTESLIGMYYMSCFIMMGVSLALSAWTNNMRRFKSTPPRFLSQVFIGCLGRIMCVDPMKEARNTDSTKGQGDEVKMVEAFSGGSDWRIIAIVTDRLLAVIFLVVVIIITLAMFV